MPNFAPLFRTSLFAIAPPHDGLGLTDIVAVACYMLLTAVIALLALRVRGSTSEFFLGGRRMPWLAVGLSIMATLMSTISYLAAPGEMIKNGVGWFASYLHYPLSMAIVLWMWVPFFMRLRMTSAYEYLERRFDHRVRLLGATLFILMRLGWLGVVIQVSSLALVEMTGANIYLVLALVGAFTTIYTSIGGIRAVIWTDVMQSVVMLAGTLITLGYVIFATGTGPADWWSSMGSYKREYTRPTFFSWDVTVRVTLVTSFLHSFFWTICTHGSDQLVTQRYFTTRSLGAAKRSAIVGVLADVTVGTLLAFCGLALLALYLDHPSLSPDPDFLSRADKVFPYFISHQLPPGLGGIILSALFAAAMSSVSSGVNSVTAVTQTDILDRYFPQLGKAMGALTQARTLSLINGGIATGVAYGVTALLAANPNLGIMELMPKGFNMFLGPMGGLFFIGMFLPHCRGKSALFATLAGVAFAVAWSYWRELFGGEQDLTFTLAIAAPCVLTVALAAVLGFLIEGRGGAAGREYSWSAVMRRPPPTDDDPPEPENDDVECA